MPSQFWSATDGISPTLWSPQRYNLDGNEGFCMYHVPLTYMAVFRQARLEPESLGPELSALKTYCGLGFHLCLMYYVSRKLFQKKKRILAIFALKSPKNRNFYIIILQYHKNELKFHIEYFNIFEKINKMCTIKSKWKNLECLHWTFRTFDCKTSLNQWVFQYINKQTNKKPQYVKYFNVFQQKNYKYYAHNF